ncbi:arylesterase [Opitutales bacterium ASA1]|nr:arylesterase [Opitutales bacterium ASA1]
MDFLHTRFRRRGFVAVVLSIAGLVFLAGCGRKASIGRLSEGAVVVAFGDSLTRGTGAAEGADYPSVLARLSGLEVVNAGVPGERAAEGLRRLSSVLERHQPQLVILCHGGNDILASASDEAIAAELGRMIETIREAGADVVLIGVPKRGLVLRSAAFYAEVAERFGVPYEEDVVADVLSTASLKSDYVHPNEKGYAMIADAVWKLVRGSQR